uniref:R3H domain-containing protein n=1 Tax=Ditylum brightwellii TaxID=49249 RepID=A0A7S1YQ46_9STRA
MEVEKMESGEDDTGSEADNEEEDSDDEDEEEEDENQDEDSTVQEKKKDAALQGGKEFRKTSNEEDSSPSSSDDDDTEQQSEVESLTDAKHENSSEEEGEVKEDTTTDAEKVKEDDDDDDDSQLRYDHYNITNEKEGMNDPSLSSSSSSSVDPNETIFSKAATILVQNIINSLPSSSISNCTIAFPTHKQQQQQQQQIPSSTSLQDYNSPYQHKQQQRHHTQTISVTITYFTLSSTLSKSIVNNFGTTMQHLDLSYLYIKETCALQVLCQGLTQLQTLKLKVVSFGNNNEGLDIGTMLDIISVKDATSIDKATTTTTASALYNYASSMSSYSSSSGGGCPNLEVLHIVSKDVGVASKLGTTTTTTSKDAGKMTTVKFSSPYLKCLCLQGCHQLQSLLLDTPLLQKIHVLDCTSLTNLGFFDDFSSFVGSTNMVQDMKLSGNLSLSPHSIAAMRLPNLKHLDIDGMTLIQDWELGCLIHSALYSLTSLRLNHCRSLGDATQWIATTPNIFHPLSVLHLRRPCHSFDASTLQAIFADRQQQQGKKVATTRNGENNRFVSGLRDLIIDHAPGLIGVICAPAHSSGGGAKSDGVSFSPSFKHPSNSRLGVGAIDEEINGGSGNNNTLSKGLLGVQGIERILSNFVESARNGSGGEEYGFPPTLSSYQRKLVHDAAEQMNLDHESICLNTGVKVVRVRVRRRVSLMDAFAEGQGFHQPGHQHIEPQAEGAGYREDAQSVAFALDEDTDQNVARARGTEAQDDTDNHGVFDIDDGVEMAVATTEQSTRETTVFPNKEYDVQDLPHPALSRREIRRANKKKKVAINNKSQAEVDDDTLSESDGDDQNIAFDGILQCEVHGRFDSKTLRRLTAMAHNLPFDCVSGKAVCIKYLRGLCPYQRIKDGGNCRYGHFNVKPSQLKKFSPLMDLVCGIEDANAGGRGKERVRRKEGTVASYGSNSGSYGAEEASQLIEEHIGKRGQKGKDGRRRGRKGSFGNENDCASRGRSRSFGGNDGLSDCGYASSRGSSPSTRSINGAVETDAFLLSNHYKTDVMFGMRNQISDPLCLQRLMSLEILGCDGLTGAVLDGPCLARLCVRDCSQLNFLDLRTPLLTFLDVSDCPILGHIPLPTESFRGLRVAIFTNCRGLTESFMTKIVDHCRALRQLHIFGSGASEKANNSRSRQKIKTKAGLTKLTAGRPKLELISTKKEWRLLRTKNERLRNSHDHLLN